MYGFQVHFELGQEMPYTDRASVSSSLDNPGSLFLYHVLFSVKRSSQLSTSRVSFAFHVTCNVKYQLLACDTLCCATQRSSRNPLKSLPDFRIVIVNRIRSTRFMHGCKCEDKSVVVQRGINSASDRV